MIKERLDQLLQGFAAAARAGYGRPSYHTETLVHIYDPIKSKHGFPLGRQGGTSLHVFENSKGATVRWFNHDKGRNKEPYEGKYSHVIFRSDTVKEALEFAQETIEKNKASALKRVQGIHDPLDSILFIFQYDESTNAKAALAALINQATVVEGHFDDYVPDTI